MGVTRTTHTFPHVIDVLELTQSAEELNFMIADGLIVDYTVNTGESYDRLGKLFASPTVTKNSSAPCGFKRE